VGLTAKIFQFRHIGVSMGECWIDLSHRIAEFNISLRHAMLWPRWSWSLFGCIAGRATIEKQGGNGHAAEVAFARRNEREQKETYDESIAGKRGAPPAPMMAWLNSPRWRNMPPGLGEQLRFNTISGEIIGDRDPRYRPALDLALRMVCPQAPGR